MLPRIDERQGERRGRRGYGSGASACRGGETAGCPWSWAAWHSN